MRLTIPRRRPPGRVDELELIRVVRRKGNDRLEPGQYFYGIHEAYYDKTTGECFAISKEPSEVFGESPSEVLETVIMMRQAIKRPVLDYDTRKEIAAKDLVPNGL